MESVFRLTDPGTRFFYTGTHWFRKGTHDISPDESQDSPYLFVTKSLIVVTFSHVYVVILSGETDVDDVDVDDVGFKGFKCSGPPS